MTATQDFLNASSFAVAGASRDRSSKALAQLRFRGTEYQPVRASVRFPRTCGF